MMRPTISGDANIINTGNNVTISQNIAPKRVLSKSLIYKLLTIVGDKLLEDDDSAMSMILPIEVREKLEINQANKYFNIFRHLGYECDVIDNVIQGIPRGEKILRRLRNLFTDVADYDANGTPIPGNGTAQLDSLRETIYEIILNDADFDADKTWDEDIRHFIDALLMYGTWKCKILWNVGELISNDTN
ncbi:hypothetical protein FQA45_14870 [Glutamicibacter halophytocola]|uniref:Uncharacterized protein n=1 Tax=Glutamicibacter halophytocola TaxID=1933880 RepID=A0ABX5YCV0_9MICC|nr:hypothetical protein [Glutamicibacter halophytocola]QDY67483.1 hypothetical protein FQA45_14870 [Glutamicibacter halophytocola]